MNTIVIIAASASKRLTVTEEDGWIVITAPVKEGRWGFEALYGMAELNDHRWNNVPSTTKVHLKGFSFARTSYDWMVNHFGENFKLSSPC